MPKSISIIAYYSFLIFYFNTTEPTAFMMLFSLIFELVLVAVIFAVFTRYHSDKNRHYTASNILLGAAPVIFFQYFIATAISSSLNEGRDISNSSNPLIVFKSPICIMIFVLILIYGYNIYDYFVKKHTIIFIEKSFIYQVLLISATGLFGVVALSVFENFDKIIVITIMAIGRMAFEVLLNRKMKALTP